MKKLIFLPLILVLLLTKSYGQFGNVEDSLMSMNIIKNQLNQTELKTMLQGEKLIKSGDDVMKKVDKLDDATNNAKSKEEKENSKKGKKKAKKEVKKSSKAARELRIKAAKTYEEGFKLVYQVLKDKLTGYQKTDQSDKKNEVEKLKTEAKNLFVQGTKKLNELKNKDSDEKVEKTLDQVYQMKCTGISNLCKSFCLYLECKKVEVVVENVVEKDTTPVVVYVDPPVVDDNKGPKGIEFKIQIIAVHRQLTDIQLGKLYVGSEQPYYFVDQSDNLYKYVVGSYKDYKEAKSKVKATGIRDAFVIAFKDGYKIPLKEALKVQK